MATIVIKLGGSLYDLPNLRDFVEELLEPISAEQVLIFPGGGAAADLVRNWQPHFRWHDRIAHDVAVAALDFNAAMLARVLPRGTYVCSREDAKLVWQYGGVSILAPWRFLNIEELDEFPHTWDVTSDSLAAWTALRWPADELWLCKSAPCPVNLSAAIADGLIDPYFAELAPQLPRVRWCDLRADGTVHTLNVRE